VTLQDAIKYAQWIQGTDREPTVPQAYDIVSRHEVYGFGGGYKRGMALCALEDAKDRGVTA
jgi:hypothetical protein